MIGLIIKQMWSKRRSNTWIFLELILVTFFMWKVIDPVFVILSNKAIDEGYDASNVFRLQLGEYSANHGRYNADQSNDSIRKLNFLRIYDMVRRYPAIESSVITFGNGYPYSGSYSSTRFDSDTVAVSLQYISFYTDGDFFKVFRVPDDATGTYENLDHRSHPTHVAYLSRDAEKKIYPKGRKPGQKLSMNKGKHSCEIAGVTEAFKFRSTDQPEPIVFMPDNKLNIPDFPYCAQICFRVKDGTSMKVFAENFKQEMKPGLNIGNYYFLDFTDFDSIRKDMEFSFGITNMLRLQISLAIFFLICTFLGIAGTFWLRSDARTGEIGLRMALGSSSRGVLKEFLTEAWLLTTFAWLVGIIIVLQYVFYSGFALPTDNPSMEFIQNRPVPHFIIISLIVYLLMLLITMIGTWIPARRVSRISPSDALRDE